MALQRDLRAEWLKPVADGFRNFHENEYDEVALGASPEELFIDEANLLKSTAPDWTVLTGGLRALNLNHHGSNTGMFTDWVGALTTDFFRHLLDTDTIWEKADERGLRFVGHDRASGAVKHRASREDLVFGANAQLRSIADVYAGRDRQQRFVRNFVRRWGKVMMLDRYDVKGHRRYPPMAA